MANSFQFTSLTRLRLALQRRGAAEKKKKKKKKKKNDLARELSQRDNRFRW